MFPKREERLAKASDETKAQSALYLLKAGRSREAANIMTSLVRKRKQLSTNERFIFAVAFWKWADECRNACRKIDSLRREQPSDSEEAFIIAHECAEYELNIIVEKLQNLIDRHLLPNSNAEEMVFYYKMLGDFCRYLATVAQNTDREELAKRSEAMYLKTSDLNGAILAHHPYRLGTVLNYATLYYEVYHDIPKAISIAETGLLVAQAAYHSASTYFEDADYVLQLTKSNIERWRTSLQKLLEAKYKSAGTAGSEASSIVRPETEEQEEIEWSHSFIITPGSFPTFQDILKPDSQDTAASALLASDLPGSAA